MWGADQCFVAPQFLIIQLQQGQKKTKLMVAPHDEHRTKFKLSFGSWCAVRDIQECKPRVYLQTLALGNSPPFFFSWENQVGLNRCSTNMSYYPIPNVWSSSAGSFSGNDRNQSGSLSSNHLRQPTSFLCTRHVRLGSLTLLGCSVWQKHVFAKRQYEHGTIVEFSPTHKIALFFGGGSNANKAFFPCRLCKWSVRSWNMRICSRP